MTPHVRAVYDELRRDSATPDAGRLLDRLATEPGVARLAESWPEIVDATTPAVRREVRMVQVSARRMWAVLIVGWLTGWAAAIWLGAANPEFIEGGSWWSRTLAAVVLYPVPVGVTIWWSIRPSPAREPTVAGLLQPYVVAASPIFVAALWSATAPWLAPVSIGLAAFTLVLAVGAAVRLAVTRAQHRRPRAWGAWFLVEALAEAGAREAAASPEARNHHLHAAVGRLDRVADLFDCWMHAATGRWDRRRRRTLDTAFAGIAAWFRRYGDELALRWEPAAIPTIADAAVAVARADWERLESVDVEPPNRARDVSRAIGRALPLALLPVVLAAGLWLLSTPVDDSALSSMTVASVVWCASRLVGAVSPDLGAEMSSFLS